MLELLFAFGLVFDPRDDQASSPPPQAQAPAPGARARLRVYLDCSDCFPDFLREEIHWVDFVRQPQDADVHLLTTSSDTGGGGREVVLRFVGANRFRDVNQDLRTTSQPADTEDARRRDILRTVSVGLLGYIAREGLPAGVALTVKSDRPEAAAVAVRDRWNFWVFNLEGGGSIDAEETQRQWDWSGNISADRVTELWKLSFGARLEEEIEEFDLDEGEPLKVTRRERSIDWFAARGLGQHWSVGFTGDVQSSTFENIKFQFSAAPAIEFSVFPYSQYVSRQLRLEYLVGVERSKYHEVTLFGKLEETLGRHEVQVTLDQRQTWGSLQAFAEFGQYLHDFSKYRFEVGGEVSYRIARGLEIELDGSASRVRDQISLPARDATPEEILLRLRELQSGYEVSFSIGLSYTFGSIFNNIVNPRFGR
jgi:hypothetical protein